jgi:hypothetical protein
MSARFEDIAKEVESMELCTSGTVDDIAIKNMFGIILTENEYKFFEYEKFISFISSLEKIIFQKWGEKEATFYCWYDAMASQIRFSSLPYINIELPFGNPPILVNNIEVIVYKMYKEYQAFYENLDLTAEDMEFVVYSKTNSLE